jgi:RNA polymerase sigma-70 factor (ECF subfamily)
MAAVTGKNQLQRKTVMAMTKDDQIDLIQRACSDTDAFAQLYLLHYDTVFRHCLRRLFERTAAQDVTSTVFFKVMRNLTSFKGSAPEFRSWLFSITTNAVNDYLRDLKRRKQLVQNIAADNQQDPVYELDADEHLLEKKALLKQALLELKPKYQTVIALRFFENMKLTEIADCLGKKPSTVRNQLARATAKLRKRIDSESREVTI